MGCGKSKSSSGTGKNRRLIEVYDVGQKLGEGAFGVVHECSHRQTGKEYAVKMIDRVEQELSEIEREIDMIQSLQHRNVVSCQEFFIDKCFVCIVMDKFTGGDLVDGLHRHLASKGKIPDYNLVHIVKQMGEAIAHLHKTGVIHRDVKGDNFLMNRENIADPECHVVLTDFGTAVHLKVGVPQKTLSEHIGTRAFWSPEMCDKNYAHKADVWAMGIVAYGLLDGTFPFKDEKQIKEKKPRFPKVSPDCTDLLAKLLDKNDESRISSVDVLKHPWLAPGGAQAESAKPNDQPEPVQQDPEEEKGKKTALKEEVNNRIAERRQELLQRQEKHYKNTAGAGAKQPGGPLKAVDFTTHGPKKGESTLWKWYTEAQLKEQSVVASGLAASDASGQAVGAKGTLIDLVWTQNIVSDLLSKHNIDSSQYGKGAAKSLQDLADEMKRGESSLMQDASDYKKLVRVVDVVLLRVCADGQASSKLLVEVSEKFADGRTREHKGGRLPGTKQRPHESVKHTARRIVATILKMSDCDIAFKYNEQELIEEKEESPSYPKLVTVYRKHIIEGMVRTKKPEVLERIGLPKGTDHSNEADRKDIKYWQWWTPKQCEAQGMKLRGTNEKATFSGLVQAPIGFTEHTVREFLEKYKVNCSAFGQGSAKTLAEIAEELSQGESCLMEDSRGQLLRVADVVLLRISDMETGRILVDAEQTFSDNRKRQTQRLPGTKRRPNENIINTARRIVTGMLKWEEDQVYISVGRTELLEEEKNSPSYPGLATVYRKHIVMAQIGASADRAPSPEPEGE